MTLRLILTDGNGVQGLAATFGAIVQTNIIQTSADAAAAAASAAAALASQNAAATSASSATGSASAAATSATNAANSASSASTSASSASGSATSASTSATNAANSASAASTSATNAANSATAAATSASNAAATLANALTKANNLSDVANAATAAHNLGLGTADTPAFTGLKLSGSTAHAVAIAQAAASAFTYAAVGTAGRVLVDNGAGVDPSFQSIGVLSGKNRIINGDCRIAQYASTAFAASASGFGGPDRFKTFNLASGQFTQSQGSITFGGIARQAVVQTVNTAVGSLASGNIWNGISQIIEGLNCFDLLGQAIAISFIFSTNVTGTYSLSLRDSTPSQSYVTSFAATAGTPVKVTIPVASLPTALAVSATIGVGLQLTIGSLNAGTYQTSTLNAWQAGNFVSASGATNWGATAGNFIALTELQVEAGSVATPFERRSYGQELALCQRYFYWTGSQQGAPLAIGQAYSTSSGGFIFELPVVMRAPPTVIASNLYGLNGGGSATYLLSAYTYGAQTDARTIYIAWGGAATAGFNAGNAVLLELGSVTGSVNGYITFAAEL